MANGLLGSQKQVGLIFQDHVLRSAVLKNQDFTGAKYNEVLLPAGVIVNGKLENKERCLRVLKKAVKKWKIKGKQVLFTVPDSSVILRILELPGSLTDDDLRTYFMAELEQRIQLPFESPVFDFHTISRTSVITKVILFAAPEAIVKEYSSLLKQCGLKPVAADLTMLAADRFYQMLDLPAGKDDHRMMIQIDLSCVNISIFHENVPLFMRSITLDPHSDEDEEDSLLKVANEIARVLNFYQFTVQKGTGSVTSIYIIGDHPSIDSYNQAIESVNALPATPLYKELLNEASSTKLKIPPKYYTAAGLVLK